MLSLLNPQEGSFLPLNSFHFFKIGHGDINVPSVLLQTGNRTPVMRKGLQYSPPTFSPG